MDVPRPDISAESAPFWEGLRQEKLLMPKCTACGHIQFPMGPCCANCLEDRFEWIELSGAGQVGAFIVYHHQFHPAFADKIPYNVAEVMLDEGVPIISNLVGIENDAIRNDMRVFARFDRIDDALTLLRFAPVADT